MLRWFLCSLGLLTTLVAAKAAGGPPEAALLQEAVERWLGERDQWAFTQRAVEYDPQGRYERLERFDPSRRGQERWQLLAVNGREPTPAQWREWADRKFRRPPRRIDTALSEYFDFSAATVVAQTPQRVRFNVPLRRDKNWIFPVDKVGVRVTVNRDTRALEQLSAHVREPFRILLGVARITDGELNLDFTLPGAAGTEAPGRPSGEVRVSAFRLGERVDYTWTEFERVTPFREPRPGRRRAAMQEADGEP
ncbi:hypothetical protein [Opitutus sp. ER46]|uniref:hypothetical protein n=1 Tax=Opitutus sp. ER46 TaxID=2161864 RepID=UPI000D312AF7|nr:hypothetical protein [Opitutus sp. ER46]PTX91495.1 hypothetical protein DB354_16540 [Opitutus sp. ER46]